MQPLLDKVNAANKAEAKNVTPKSSVTLNDVVAEWRKLVAPNHKPRGVKAAESHLRAHILPKLGKLPLSELTQKTLQGFVAQLTPGCSGKTVENVLLTLSGILGHARKWYKDVPKFKLSDLSMPEVVQAKPRFLSAKEIKRLIAQADEPFKRILLTLALTGCRINEVLGLRVEDIDFEGKLIRITKSAYNGTLGSPKSKASAADIPLSATLEEALRKHLESEHYRENSLGVIFTNVLLRPYSDSRLRKDKLHPLLKSPGMKPAGFHAIRHGVASELFNRGAPITVVQAQMRHSDVRVTLSVYGHVIGNAQREAVEKLAKQMVA